MEAAPGFPPELEPIPWKTQDMWMRAAKRRRQEIEDSDQFTVKFSIKNSPGSYWLSDKLVGYWQLKQKGNRLGIHGKREEQIWAFLSYDCPPEGKANRLENEIATFSQHPLATYWSLHVLRGPQYNLDGFRVGVVLWVGKSVSEQILEAVKNLFDLRAPLLGEVHKEYCNAEAHRAEAHRLLELSDSD